jgi:hypothetical protein
MLHSIYETVHITLCIESDIIIMLKRWCGRLGKCAHNHYGKLRLCRAYTALPRAFCRALGRVDLCREPPSAQVDSQHNHLCRRPDRRHRTTLGKTVFLPRVSSWDITARRRRTDGRYIWLLHTVPTARSRGPSAKSALVKGPPPVDCVENPVDPPLPRA